jgi:hypothetical protein
MKNLVFFGVGKRGDIVLGGAYVHVIGTVVAPVLERPAARPAMAALLYVVGSFCPGFSRESTYVSFR